MAHGYEQTPISSIREQLLERGQDEGWVNENTKKALVVKLLALKKIEELGAVARPAYPDDDEGSVADFDDSVTVDDPVIVIPFDMDVVAFDEPSDDEVLDEDEIPRVQPAFDSPEWTDYVISHLEDDELEGVAPKADGLRRMVQHFLGPIVSHKIIRNAPPTLDNNATATVVVGITVHLSDESVHPAAIHRLLEYQDVADCGKYNTEDPYHKHQSATAATRAEGRIYRKMLGLKGRITAEEKAGENNEDFDEICTPDEPITEEQINMIDVVCGRLNIDVMGFLNCGKKDFESIYEVTLSTAQKMMQHLNRVQQSKADRPPNVGDYRPDWR